MGLLCCLQGCSPYHSNHGSVLHIEATVLAPSPFECSPEQLAWSGPQPADGEDDSSKVEGEEKGQGGLQPARFLLGGEVRFFQNDQALFQRTKHLKRLEQWVGGFTSTQLSPVGIEEPGLSWLPWSLAWG